MKKLLVKLSVSTVLFVIIFTRMDFDQVLKHVLLLDSKFIPVILMCLIGNYVISAIRWKSLLIFENSNKVTFWYLIRLYFVGAFFNNFMPTSIGGDAYKVYTLGKDIKSTTNAFSATFMERFTGVIALTLFVLFGFIKLDKFWGILAFFGFWGGIFVFVFLLNYLTKLNFSNKFLKKITVGIDSVYKSFSQYKHHKKSLFWAFATSLIVQPLSVATQFFIFKSIGINLSIIYSLFVFPLIFLIGYFVPSVNGLGVQDGLYISMFSYLNVSIVLSASFLYHFFKLLVSLIGGGFYVLDRKK